MEAFSHERRRCLTIERPRPVYWQGLSPPGRIRFGATIYSIITIFAVSLMPAEHVHSSGVEGSLVHRHAAEHSADHHDAFSHADHESTTTLAPTFISARSFTLVRPLMTGGYVIAAPERQLVQRLDRGDDPLPHGPPVRLDSLPAPPA